MEEQTRRPCGSCRGREPGTDFAVIQNQALAMLGGQVASQRGTTAPGIRQRVQGKPAGWVVSTAGELSLGGARLLGLGRAGRPGREVILGARLAGHQRRPTVS